MLKNETKKEDDEGNEDNELGNLEKTKKIRFGNEPTLNEKIDYIYKALKAQRRNARIKLFLLIYGLASTYYFFVSYGPTITGEKTGGLTKLISTQINAIAKPMVEEISKGMKESSKQQQEVESGNEINTGSEINTGNIINTGSTIDKIPDGKTNIDSSKLKELYKKNNPK